MKRMEFEQFLERCINEEVLSSTSGGGVGSLWSIKFRDGTYFMYIAIGE